MENKQDFFDMWYWEIVKPSTACKHGTHDCEKCGTSSKRDRVHKTVNGKGVVGKLK